MDYNGPLEVALTTDLRGEPHNFALWDVQTGSQLLIFKGVKSNAISSCLQFVDNNYFISANDNIIHIWSILSRKCQDQKLFLPGRPSALCLSPCSNYMVVGIAETIYVWHLKSGSLLAHAQRHYQTVKVLRFNQEGTHLLSGAEDGLVLVWAFADLISGTHNIASFKSARVNESLTPNEPVFSWQHHGGQITDILVTNSGICITSSLDSTINIYSYVEGKRIHTVAFPSPICSIIMNKNETLLFVGCQDGDIYQMTMTSLGLSFMLERDGDTSRKPVFSGHKNKVISMAITMDGTRLVSASHDCSCKVWDIQRKTLIRDIKHQAPLANLLLTIAPENLALTTMTTNQSDAEPLALRALKRTTTNKNYRDGIVGSGSIFEDCPSVMYIRNKKNLWVPPEQVEHSSITSVTRNQISTKPYQEQDVVDNLKLKLKDLLKLSAEKVFSDAAHPSLDPYTHLVAGIEHRPAKLKRSKATSDKLVTKKRLKASKK